MKLGDSGSHGSGSWAIQEATRFRKVRGVGGRVGGGASENFAVPELLLTRDKRRYRSTTNSVCGGNRG